ncbi:MAG: hypothetical protein AB7J13_16910 [Pyrinomonadaceae bacterium]
MPENNHNEHAYDPAVQSEDIAFKTSELVNCLSCGRANPPNRPSCVYCGRELETSEISTVKLSLREPEDWERGWNVIVLPNPNDPGPNIAVLSSVVGTDADRLNALLGYGRPVPVTRLAVRAEAQAVIKRLTALGMDCQIVVDTELQPHTLPIRLRRIEIADDHLLLHFFNTHENERVDRKDLALLVTGTIRTIHTDSLERKRRRGKESKVLDETTTGSDEAVLDIYSRQDSRGWRVQLAGFDFSCLGEDKGVIAGENLRRLVTILKEYAPAARVVTDYSALSKALDAVWPPSSRKDPQGLRRAGFGKVEFGSVASTSNLVQFNRYSRLQWHLL